jgi:hypothetical protein
MSLALAARSRRASSPRSPIWLILAREPMLAGDLQQVIRSSEARALRDSRVSSRAETSCGYELRGLACPALRDKSPGMGSFAGATEIRFYDREFWTICGGAFSGSISCLLYTVACTSSSQSDANSSPRAMGRSARRYAHRSGRKQPLLTTSNYTTKMKQGHAHDCIAPPAPLRSAGPGRAPGTFSCSWRSGRRDT